MDEIETLQYDEKRVIAEIVCQTCGTTMSLHRGRFPICDDCLKVLREIINDEHWTDRFNLYKDSEGIYRIECYADQSSPINYCPMCGRELNEEKEVK